MRNSESAPTEVLAQLFTQKIVLQDERIDQMHAVRHALAERAAQVCSLLVVSA